MCIIKVRAYSFTFIFRNISQTRLFRTPASSLSPHPSFRIKFPIVILSVCFVSPQQFRSPAALVRFANIWYQVFYCKISKNLFAKILTNIILAIICTVLLYITYTIVCTQRWQNDYIFWPGPARSSFSRPCPARNTIFNFRPVWGHAKSVKFNVLN